MRSSMRLIWIVAALAGIAACKGGGASEPDATAVSSGGERSAKKV